MSARLYLLMLTGYLLTAVSCNHDKKTTAAPPVAPVAIKKAELTDPFRFHKLVEVSPGQDYDVLSWGRGSTSVGSFLVLHSDSASKKYTTTTGDLDGAIIDVYNSDMDLDGNPELLIQAKANDTADYATIYAFEFNNSRANKLAFPKLTSSQRKGYRGGDNFYIKEGKFMREFPIYDGNGKDAKSTGAKRVLEYGLRSNSFTVKQLSKDSADRQSTAVAPVATKKSNAGTEKKSTKKHSTEKKSKKKKRRS